ncbi:stalk domain-containing protein [Candidatus Formimonas warabiya]|uniref:Copper amine oxidase n=1 Tax=Formimonas warabiya TaxID=1761012 RepID=A0A3G1L082_FORW1|nr:stalk domain-containing protein [Candidatus Formimonas warabiya]ATW28183.1 copper amine oxidase [Candidatus Formimonas warabiya]
MKAFVSLLTCVVLVCFFALPAFAQEREITVRIDGLAVPLDTPPLLDNGRTLIPFRAITEALNIPVVWDEATRTITATDGVVNVMLQIGSTTAYRNDVPISLDALPQIIEGRTLIPLRFFGEAYNCQVVWDSAKGEVRITSPSQKMAVFGFYALGDSRTSSWEDLFAQPYPAKGTGNTDLVSDLALGWYSLDREGTLLTKSTTGWQQPDGWEDVLEAAREYGMSTEMVVHLTDSDSTISDLLADETAMEEAVQSIGEEAELYQGVNLDFEGLGYRDEGEQLEEVQDRFTAFVSLLSQQLHATGHSLTLTLHAPNSAYKGYDYQALGTLADQIIIMAYDYGTQPEPVSLVQQAVEMAASSVPPQKLFLGISAPSESGESITTKVAIAKRYHLGGIALWRLGLVTDDMWQSLRLSIQPK